MKQPSLNSDKTGSRSPSVEDETARKASQITSSAGVSRIAAISECITPKLRVWMFFGVFLVAYSYGIDGSVRGVMQAEATSGYAAHSLLATVNVLRSIIAAAAQPPLAKVADVFGRIELILLSIFFFVLGTVLEAVSSGVKLFCTGAVFYQLGYTAIILLVEVTIGDVTSLRSRLFFSYIPATPFLINAWVGGDVAQATLEGTSWRWGVGMFAIIFPITCIPLISALWIAARRAERSGKLDNVKSAYSQLGFKRMAVRLFWELDIVGLVLLIAFLSLVLLPFTLAGGESANWHRAHIISMLVIGLLCAPAFAVWEYKYAQCPCVPFHLLKDRTVVCCLFIAMALNMSWYLQGDYLYTVLVVSYGMSIKAATRVSSLYSFTSVIVGVALGVIVRFVRRLKPFMIAGVLVFILAFGLLIRYRGGVSDTAGVIGAQVVLGVAGGMFPYPAQALIQSATKRQHLAIITALYLSSYSIGSALGNSVSGAIWTQVLPGKLASRLQNDTLVTLAYNSPFAYVVGRDIGTPERDAVVEAYKEVQRLLCITGICLCVPLLVCVVLVRNPLLGKEQSHEGAEGEEAQKGEKVEA